MCFLGCSNYNPTISIGCVVMQIDIESIFSYHAPLNTATREAHENVRREVKTTAQMFAAELPDSPEKALAIRKLQEAMMYANSAIAQHGARV